MYVSGKARTQRSSTGPAGLDAFRDAYPTLAPASYAPGADPAALVEGADLVVMHEWNEPALVAALGTLRVRHEMAYPRPTWRDGAFRAVWWLALGWGFAEAAVSIAQGYEQLALYRNVMVPVERVKAILAQSRQWGTSSVTFSNNASREYMPLSPRTEHGPSPQADGYGSGNANVDTNGMSGNGGGFT